MHYSAKITKEEGTYLVSFPDFENINSCGDTIEKALLNASEALNGALESDFERGFSLPAEKKYSGKNYFQIQVHPHLEIAYTLRRLRKNRSQIDVARALGISYQAYQRLENPRKCNPTIKTLEKISQVLGRKLEVSFS
jgi:antitoxin HicB